MTTKPTKIRKAKAPQHDAHVKALEASGQGYWPHGLRFRSIDAAADSPVLKMLARAYY